MKVHRSRNQPALVPDQGQVRRSASGGLTEKPRLTPQTRITRSILSALLTGVAYTVSATDALLPDTSFTPQIHIETVDDLPYDYVREALEEAIASEGLAAPVVSYFGDMLARTAADLGHAATLYHQAHIYTFCTVSAAAQLATENPAFIALCPLSIAIYQLPADNKVQLAYRPNGLLSAGGEMANDTQARIVENTLSVLGLR